MLLRIVMVGRIVEPLIWLAHLCWQAKRHNCPEKVVSCDRSFESRRAQFPHQFWSAPGLEELTGYCAELGAVGDVFQRG